MVCIISGTGLNRFLTVERETMFRIAYSNVMAERVGPKDGIAVREWRQAVDQFGGLCQTLREQRAAGQLAFMDLPHHQADAEAMVDLARRVRGRFRYILQIGIGGSALGATALYNALGKPLARVDRSRSPRLFVLDNIDPEETRAVIDRMDPRETLYHVVTKSGETVETIATFLVFLHQLKARVGKEYRGHLVFSTDPEKGFLRRLARKEKIQTFDIPPGVGGRFSVLSPVGLIPAALTGIDIRALLAGAARMDPICSRTRAEDNPAFVAALIHHLLDTRRGKTMAVFMPYARALREVADWFIQLWAESLGKKLSLAGKVVHAGQTPIRALGATDQHSVVQLFREGPNNKMFVFLEVERFRGDVEIPSLYPKDETTGFLGGQTLGRLLNAEKRGTEVALTEAGRPNYTLHLSTISPETVGGLLYFLEVQTAFAGLLYNINAFDQPGVEAGKRAAFALMGRKGYEDLRQQIERRFGEGGKYMVD
jgi:glucose-6-phosphate isomerase